MNIAKSIIPKSIIPVLILAIILNILRIIIWGKFSYLYLLWNILLSFIPYIISLILVSLHREEKINNFFILFGLLFWILFIPNAHYLITDFIHLDEVKHAPLLFDTFLIFSSALTGLLFGLYSLSHVDEIIKSKFSKRISSIILLSSFILIGFGIYLGRFLRFNSWDFFTNHASLWKGVSSIFYGVNGGVNAILYIILFTSFVYVSYKMWKYLKQE